MFAWEVMFRRICHTVSLAAALWAGLAAPVCSAVSDADSPTSLFDMPIEELMNMEVQTVYGASKHEQKVAEAPASITIVTQEEIKRFGYRTLADILEGTRSFYRTYNRNYQYAGVRAFGRPSDYDNRILILLDGHRLNENIGGASPVGTDLPVDVDLIDHVEIIRGPGSSLYGTNALFGVINVVTRNGRDYGTLEVKGEGASSDTIRGRVTYGQAWDDGPDVLVSATGFDSDGSTLYYSEFDDPATNSGRVHHDGQQYSSLFAKASYDHLTFTAAHVTMEKEVPTAPYGIVFGDPRTGTRDETTLVGLSYVNDITEDFSVSTNTYYQVYGYHGWFAYDWAEEPDPPYVVVNKDLWDGRWWTGELTFTNHLPGGHHLTWGAESQYNQRQKQKNWDQNVYLDDSRHSWNYALFAQDEFPIIDRLLMIAGVRFDDYERQTDRTNPRLGLIYEHSDATSLKALYGTAYRAPTVYELYYQDGVSWKRNPDLKPEVMQTTELVLEHRVSDATSFAVTGFYYQLDRLIEQYTDPADGMLAYRNGGMVTGHGAEFELTHRRKSGLTTTGSYSYTDAEDDATGGRPVNSPRHLAKFRVKVPLIEKKFFAGVETLYRGDVRTLGGRTAGGFSVVNLTLTYDNIVPNLDAGLSIYNLFNKQYGYPGGGENIQDILAEDGTTAAFHLVYRF